MTPLRFREKRKNRGLRAICRDCAGKKVEGRLKPAEADRALDGYSLSSDAGLAAPRRREVAPSGDERGVGGIYERFQTNKN